MNSAFPFQVLLCFSNGNHFDIVYPIKYKESSAVCQCKYHPRVGLDIFFLSFVVLSKQLRADTLFCCINIHF